MPGQPLEPMEASAGEAEGKPADTGGSQQVLTRVEADCCCRCDRVDSCGKRYMHASGPTLPSSLLYTPLTVCCTHSSGAHAFPTASPSEFPAYTPHTCLWYSVLPADATAEATADTSWFAVRCCCCTASPRQVASDPAAAPPSAGVAAAPAATSAAPAASDPAASDPAAGPAVRKSDGWAPVKAE